MKRLRGSFNFLNLSLPKDLIELFVTALRPIDRHVIYEAYAGTIHSDIAFDEDVTFTSLSRVQWLYEKHNFVLESNLYYGAARENKQDFIQWLEKKQVLPLSYAMQGAASVGNLDLMETLMEDPERDHQVDESVALHGINKKNFAVVQFALLHGAEISSLFQIDLFDMCTLEQLEKLGSMRFCFTNPKLITHAILASTLQKVKCLMEVFRLRPQGIPLTRNRAIAEYLVSKEYFCTFCSE